MGTIKIPTAGMSRQEWLKLRKGGLGGSDAGAVCGLNPYASPMSVYKDKTSDEIEEKDNEAMRQGRDLEDYAARRFMEATGLKVRRSNVMYKCEEHPFMLADVDRLVVGEDAGLECKTASALHGNQSLLVHSRQHGGEGSLGKPALFRNFGRSHFAVLP